jgi:hypothetical protein
MLKIHFLTRLKLNVIKITNNNSSNLKLNFKTKGLYWELERIYLTNRYRSGFHRTRKLQLDGIFVIDINMNS